MLTPLIAELALGSTSIRMIWLLPLWTPIYGAGVLLIREAVRRAGGGLGSLLVLGLAYELAEDGIGLQALTSPHLYGAAHEGPRVLGFNSVYWEENLFYHVVFSVLIPIALTELLYPSHRNRPYLKRTGTIITAVCALLGIALLRVSVPPSQDPGYAVPLPILIGYAVAIAALAVVALVVLPRRKRRRPDATAVGVTGDMTGGVPGRAALAALGSGATVLVLGLLFPFAGARHPAFTDGGLSTLVPMAVAAALTVGLLVAVRRWAARPGWTDRSALALMGGALVGHTAIGIVLMWKYGHAIDHIGLVVLAVLEVVAVVLLDRRLVRRAARAAAPAAAVS